MDSFEKHVRDILVRRQHETLDIVIQMINKYEKNARELRKGVDGYTSEGREFIAARKAEIALLDNLRHRVKHLKV